jgi:hypothetical protein
MVKLAQMNPNIGASMTARVILVFTLLLIYLGQAR